jgi:hypothetical protein
VSRHYHWIRKKFSTKEVITSTWPKLSLLCTRKSQIIVTVVAGRGPYHDSKDFHALLTPAAKRLKFAGLLGDKAYDSEAFHRRCREELGMSWTAIRVRGARSGAIPVGKYRRLMHTHFPRAKYRQRGQVESLFSRFKRRLGSTLRSRSWTAQCAEIHARVLAYNLGLLSPLTPDLLLA